MTWGVSNSCDGSEWQPAGETREEAIAFGRRIFPEYEETTFFVAELEPWEPGDLFDAWTIGRGWLNEYGFGAHHDGPKVIDPEFPEDSLRETLRAWARRNLGHLHTWQTCGDGEEIDICEAEEPVVGTFGETLVASGKLAVSSRPLSELITGKCEP